MSDRMTAGQRIRAHALHAAVGRHADLPTWERDANDVVMAMALRSAWWTFLHALPTHISVRLRVRLYGRSECAECHVPAWLNPRWGHAEWLGHEWVDQPTSIYDRLVPASALRWGRLTNVWPWSDANPAVGPVVDPAALWGMATDPDLPTWVVQLGGHRFPLVELMDRVIRPTPPPRRRPWRKRR